ncbi:MAG: DUF2490 domain-containing protein [Acidobacteriota bacterium]
MHLEAHVRRAGMGSVWQQLLLRPAVNYQLTKKISLSTGYTYLYTYPFGDHPPARGNPEHRWHEQLTYTHRVRKMDWQHRFRWDHRFIGQVPAGLDHATSYRYENRLRYQFRTGIPIRWGDGRNYIALYDEVMFNFGKNVDRNVFDQNRAFIGLGRNLNDTTRVEAGYLEQDTHRRGGELYLRNHTFQITLFSRLRFGH